MNPAFGEVRGQRFAGERGCGPGVVARVWFGGFWQQWSGYLLLALSVACVLALFAHTGIRLGVNVNAALMGFYLATLLSGALAGLMIGAVHRLRQVGIDRTGQTRRVLLWLHVAAICPLPALLAVHILAAYLFRAARAPPKTVFW